MGWYPEGVGERGLHCNWFITLKNPNIKRTIFICCPCTFLYNFYRSRREKLSKVLIKFILCDHVFFYIYIFSQTTVFLYALRQRRIWHWALLQTELKLLYLKTNEPMKVNMMKVNMPPPHPHKKKKNNNKTFCKTTSRKKRLKVTKKTANFWAKN